MAVSCAYLTHTKGTYDGSLRILYCKFDLACCKLPVGLVHFSDHSLQVCIDLLERANFALPHCSFGVWRYDALRVADNQKVHRAEGGLEVHAGIRDPLRLATARALDRFMTISIILLK